MALEQQNKALVQQMEQWNTALEQQMEKWNNALERQKMALERQMIAIKGLLVPTVSTASDQLSKRLRASSKPTSHKRPKS